MGDTPVRHASAVLFVIAFSAFLATFNETFLNVALTPIMGDFSISSATVQWVSTAYMLVAAIAVPVTSFLYRSVPTRRLSILAMSLLLVGTLVGALASTFPVLLVARVIQALGTGMVVPIGMNLTLLVAPEGRLGSYMGVVSAVTLLGPAFGPIAGGALLSVANWHVLFAVFGAVVLVCLVLTCMIVKNFATLTHPDLDVPSVTLASLALVGILYGISTMFSGNRLIAACTLVIGLVCAVSFVIRQHKIPEPLLDLRPFGDRAFSTGLVVVFVAFMAVFAMNIILPLFMQGSLGFTSMDAAITLFIPCLLCCLCSLLSGQLFDRFGLAFTLPAALVIMGAFLFALARFSSDASSVLLAALYAPVLVGCAFSVGPAQSFALGRLSSDLHPHGVTMCYTAIQVAGCVGSSFYVGIMSFFEETALASGAGQQAALSVGFSGACAVAACFAFIGFIFAVVTARSSLQEHHRHEKNLEAEKAAR